MKKHLLTLIACIICTHLFSQKLLEVGKVPRGTVVIDGKLDEPTWSINSKITNQIDISSLECGSTVPGPIGNNSAEFGLLWDSSYLYLGVKVMDTQIMSGDNVDLFLSMDNDRSSNCPNNWPRAYTASTMGFQFSPSSNTFASFQGAESAVSEFKFTSIPGGYILETKLIWEELDFFLGQSPNLLNRLIGFDIGVNDDDLNATRTSELMWNQCCSNRNWTEAINFGTIRLSSDVCSQPVVKSLSKCENSSVTLTATGGTTYKWYKSTNDALPFFTGPDYTTPTLTSSTTYYVSNQKSNCESKRTPVTVTINKTIPNLPSGIMGDSMPCANSSKSYKVSSENEVLYKWRIVGGNLISNQAESIEVQWMDAGPGQIGVTASNACGKSEERILPVSVKGSPLNKFSISGPTSVCAGKIATHRIVGDSSFSYMWHYSSESGNVISESNMTLIKRWDSPWSAGLSAVSYNKCGSSTPVNFGIDVINKPSSPGICRVSADKSGSLVEIRVFPIYYQSNLDSLLVYREGKKANLYQFIGSAPINAGYIFTDKTALPSQQEYRYKVAFKDSCGNISDLSQYHKTMYLSMNKGASENIWNLVWTPYFGVYEVPSYEIYRGVTPNNLSYLNTVSGNINSYTDFTAPAGTSVYYQIKIKEAFCAGVQTDDDGEIRSNIMNFNVITGTIGGEENESLIKVFPNPNQGEFTIEMNNGKGELRITNMLGQTVLEKKVDQVDSSTLVSGLAPGIYLMEVNLGTKMISKKIIVK